MTLPERTVAPVGGAMVRVAFVLGWKGFVNIIVQMPRGCGINPPRMAGDKCIIFNKT